MSISDFATCAQRGESSDAAHRERLYIYGQSGVLEQIPTLADIAVPTVIGRASFEAELQLLPYRV